MAVNQLTVDKDLFEYKYITYTVSVKINDNKVSSSLSVVSQSVDFLSTVSFVMQGLFNQLTREDSYFIRQHSTPIDCMLEFTNTTPVGLTQIPQNTIKWNDDMMFDTPFGGQVCLLPAIVTIPKELAYKIEENDWMKMLEWVYSQGDLKQNERFVIHRDDENKIKVYSSKIDYPTAEDLRMLILAKTPELTKNWRVVCRKPIPSWEK